MTAIARLIVLVLTFGFFANVSNANELLIAPPSAPRYQLSNIRTEVDHFGRPNIVVDYKLIKKAKGNSVSVDISGKTKNGELNVIWAGNIKESGQFRIATHRIFGSINDVELYLVTRAQFRKQYKLSNSVRLGNPGPATRARPMNAEEKEALERMKLMRTPPGEVPDGYVPAAAETVLVPGMPVKAGYLAKWEDAEVLNADAGGQISLKFSGAIGLQLRRRENWIAVKPEILAKATTDPDQFQPSVRVLPGSRLVIPDGAIPLASDVALLAGTPLLYDYGLRWREVFVVSSSFDSIKLRYKRYGPTWDKTEPRKKFLIKEETLKLLAEAGAEERFAKNLQSSSGGFPSHRSSASKIRHHAYPVTIPVPKGAQFLSNDLTVVAGTPLASCYASKWNPVTVVHENEDGSVRVSWDEWSGVHRDTIREQLIIEDKTVAKLERKSRNTDEDLKITLRTWTDITGNFKIEAWYVGKTATDVTLRTDAGRVLTLPLEKLSNPDRELVAAQKEVNASDNPFTSKVQ